MSILFLCISYLFLAAQAILYFFIVLMAIPGSPSTSAEYGLHWFLFLVGLPTLCVIAAVVMTVAYLFSWQYPYAWAFAPLVGAILFPFVMFR